MSMHLPVCLVAVLGLSLFGLGRALPEAGQSGAAARVPVGFSEGLTGEALPNGWQEWRLGSDRSPTLYRLSGQSGAAVLEAVSANSASALLRTLDVELRDHPFLNWTWKSEGDQPVADWRDLETDDYALRMFVLFKEKRGRFSFLKRFVPGFQGQALNYVVSPTLAPGTIGDSPASERVKMVAVGSPQPSGTWRHHSRNVVTDYREAFGESPGEVEAVAVMTDTDNAGGVCIGYFTDIYFSRARGRLGK